MHGREALLKKEQKKRDQLTSKIKAMESKLLAGNIKDRSDVTKTALDEKRQEVIAQKVRLLQGGLSLANTSLLFSSSGERERSDSSWPRKKKARWK